MEQKKKLMCGLCHLVMVCCLCIFFPIVKAQSVYQLSVDNALPTTMYVRFYKTSMVISGWPLLLV